MAQKQRRKRVRVPLIERRTHYWTNTGGFDAGFATKEEAMLHAAVLYVAQTRGLSGVEMSALERHFVATQRALELVRKANEGRQLRLLGSLKQLSHKEPAA